MDKDYLDPLLNSKTLRWVEPYHGGMSLDDTGLCNRLLHWGIAYKINQLNNFKYTILLQDEYWSELKYLNLPYTRPVRNPYYSSQKVTELKFKTVYDYQNQHVYLAEPLSKEAINNMLQNKTFTLKGDNYYSDFGYNFIKEFENIGKNGITSIRFKHKEFEKIIAKEVKGYIGIHIRRGHGVEVTLDHIKKLPKEIQPLFSPDEGDSNYKWISDLQYFKVIDGILEKYPRQKFYLSTDMTLDQYQYLLDRYPGRFKTRKEIFNKVFFTSNYYEKIDDFQLTCFINVIDLFTLASCSYIIKSPASTWSEIAAMWRDKPSINIDKHPKDILKQINLFLRYLNRNPLI